MLEGRVNRHGEPIVATQLILRTRPSTFSAVIDTGFNDHLSVPKRLLRHIRHSRWQAIGMEKFEIATGAIIEQEIFLGEIVFDGQRSPAYAVVTRAQNMFIGTKLLTPCASFRQPVP